MDYDRMEKEMFYLMFDPQKAQDEIAEIVRKKKEFDLKVKNLPNQWVKWVKFDIWGKVEWEGKGRERGDEVGGRCPDLMSQGGYWVPYLSNNACDVPTLSTVNRHMCVKTLPSHNQNNCHHLTLRWPWHPRTIQTDFSIIQTGKYVKYWFLSIRPWSTGHGSRYCTNTNIVKMCLLPMLKCLIFVTLK